MAVQDEPASGLAAAVGPPPAPRGLEVDEVPGRQGRAPPADERGARAEREVTPLAGLEQQVVEAVEGNGRRFVGRDEPVARVAGGRAGVVADDGHAVTLGAADPLPGRLRDGRRSAASSSTPSAPAGASSGGATAGSPRSAWNPAAAIVVAEGARPRPGTSGSAATTSIPSAASASPIATRRAAELGRRPRPSRPDRAAGTRCRRGRAASVSSAPAPGLRRRRRGSAAASRSRADARPRPATGGHGRPAPRRSPHPSRRAPRAARHGCSIRCPVGGRAARRP